MSNRLLHETSPYLLQHAENPVDWYPWGEEAFRKAKEEDKPVFLSIGYSTCHWCHVMAHESFEDQEIADLLNRHFVSIKVDKEERPDVDTIYMAVCQAFTGSGGWPTSIFMTPDQKPFFAGTYFPKRSRGHMIGFQELLQIIHEKWTADRFALLRQADEWLTHLKQSDAAENTPTANLQETAIQIYKRIYDRKNGGFGRAPKFPAPHNLFFLMTYHERFGDEECMQMAEHTLIQMYRGGMFDHVGFGFCRYSTDERYVAPHFEKMLYDNALLMMAYCQAYGITKNPLYLDIAEKTAAYILQEMTSPEGGFYSAQDADSEGEEGKYYLFTPDEILHVLGKKEGRAFCKHFDITTSGNFEGKSIPNLLHSDPKEKTFDSFTEQLYAYRKERHSLHLDDKILTAWNALMIAAFCRLYQVSGKDHYLDAAKRADQFLSKNLMEGGTLYVSYRKDKCGARGFLDDYAAYIFAQLALHGVTLDGAYLEKARQMCREINRLFRDEENGGYFFYGADHEPLILRPKETYDGAIPSGNSLMAWNLCRLYQLTGEAAYEQDAKQQLHFLAKEAAQAPTGHAMFLLASLNFETPPPQVVVVQDIETKASKLPLQLPLDTAVILQDKSGNYPMKNGKTTYYICHGHHCLPPTNDLSMHDLTGRWER
ncbi:MAG: thioredoxin domain-containing protein [Clostridiales bacterium]|nr:thioredoxin domain-containing protein [Clostridiales bacterium]